MSKGSPILTVRLDQPTVDLLKTTAATLQMPVSDLVRFAINAELADLVSSGLAAGGHEGEEVGA